MDVNNEAGHRNSGPGSRGAVLVVGGTHGNEINGPWLLQTWRRGAVAVASGDLAVRAVIGNPEALAANRRYIDRDLNRSFDRERLADTESPELEVARARHLLERHGPTGMEPCLVAIDLHSTTAAMGNSLVVYGRRPADLALAAGIQQRLGLPVYLHEGDPAQTGYLCERWPCGLVIEVGPVAQGLLNPAIVQQTRLALEEALAVLAAARSGRLRLPEHLVVHRHCGTLDVPRDGQGAPSALIHPQRLGRDWQPIQPGDPLFLSGSGEVIRQPAGVERTWPVFINEAAYGEKHIALALTERDHLQRQASWLTELEGVARRLEADQRGGPL